MASRVQLQAPAHLFDSLNLCGEADDILNVPAWEELNEHNKEEGASPEKVEEGDTYALLDRNCFTEAFHRKVFVLVVDEFSYIFDEFGEITPVYVKFHPKCSPCLNSR